MARIEAAQILLALIVQKKSLSQLRSEFEKVATKDRGLVQELCYGVARWYFRLEFIANFFIKKPLKAKDQDIQILILLGLYQLIFMRIPDYAAISETVEVARHLQKEWATKLINGVLRSYLKNKSNLNEKIAQNKVANYAHPAWLINGIQNAWESWREILEANNSHPLLCIRVNALKTTRQNYKNLLTAEDIAAIEIPYTDHGLVLNAPLDIRRLPGFEEGLFSIQDGAAQLAAEILQPQKDERILDACAAPGGKTCHLLEIQPHLKSLVALDNDDKRLALLRENLHRLDLQAQVINHTVTNLDWWDQNQFDRILLDAPCSATGVISRHPDIKLLRRPEDLFQLRQIQYKALETLWPTLKPQGWLLYVTCSVFPEENSQIISKFMTNHPDCIEQKIHASWGIAQSSGRQILPGMIAGMDGFYFALLQKE